MIYPFNRGARLLVGLIALGVMLARPAAAQSPGSSETSTDQTLAQDLASAPAPGKSSVSITVGGQIQQGRTETKGMKVDGIFAHSTQRKDLIRLDAEIDYARYRPAAGEDELVVENSQQATLFYLRPQHKRLYLFGSTAWRRDMIVGLNYRAYAEAGAGTVVVARANVDSFIGLSYALGREHRPHTNQGAAVSDIGILQNFHWRISDIMGIEEWFKGHLQVTDSDDQTYTFNVSLMSKLTKYAGLKIYYKRQYDALTPPTVSNLQNEIGMGVQINFKPAATAKP